VSYKDAQQEVVKRAILTQARYTADMSSPRFKNIEKTSF
jgi:hypothetical protein